MCGIIGIVGTRPVAERLAHACFDAEQSSVFVWLGVVPYLTREAVFATLGFIARCAGSEVVFDYGEPPQSSPPEIREARARRAAAVAALGEPWLTFFEPAELKAELRALGFSEVEDLGSAAIAARFFKMAEPQRQARGGGHLIRARRF